MSKATDAARVWLDHRYADGKKAHGPAHPMVEVYVAGAQMVVEVLRQIGFKTEDFERRLFGEKE